MTPNVSGQDTELPVQRNVLLKAGRVLFRIDRAPHEYKVRQLRAALAEARPKVEQLKANVDVADADLKSLRTQWERADKRREDLETLGRRQATSQFNVEGAIAQANALAAQLDAAKARLVGAKGEGQFAASGAIQRVSQIGLTVDYAVRIGAPKCLGQSAMRLGMSGAATVFSDSAGAIGTLASILLWVEAHLMYLRNP